MNPNDPMSRYRMISIEQEARHAAVEQRRHAREVRHHAKAPTERVERRTAPAWFARLSTVFR